MRRGTLLALALLLLTRLALGAAYSLVVPVWEAYDEDGHYAYVRYLAKYRHLLDPADPEAWAVYEGFQPPLYYILVAPFLMGYDLGATQPVIERNPHFTNGNAGLNYALHPPHLTGQAAETASAVHTARLVGVVISTLSVLFVYHMARRVWPRQDGPAWAATVLYAFWPQFIFNASVITNDLLVTALSAGVLAVAVQLVTEGFRPGRALALAVLLAGAVLSKINALALLPVAVLATAISLAPLLRQARWRSPWPWLALVGLVSVVAGALYALNSLHFVTGQVLHVGTLMQFFNNLAQPEARASLLTAIPYGFRTFYASFGWGNVETRPWLYDLWTVGFGLGLLGLVVGAVRRRRAHGWALLLMGLMVVCVLLV
jgi:4-amino-4-deoxy-L-arabinose transferase-like glycosyltransferase